MAGIRQRLREGFGDGSGRKQSCGKGCGVGVHLSTELMLPVRTKGSFSEPGLPVKLKKTMADDDTVNACWPDGSSHDLENLTVKQLRELTFAKPASGEGVLFEVMHTATRNKITLRQKVDRKLLLVMKEQDKQVCMVFMNQFGPVPDEGHQLEPSHTTAVAAVKFMQCLATDFANDVIKRSDLREQRDKRLAELGIEKNRGAKRAMKKPAAARSKAEEADTQHGGGTAAAVEEAAKEAAEGEADKEEAAEEDAGEESTAEEAAEEEAAKEEAAEEEAAEEEAEEEATEDAEDDTGDSAEQKSGYPASTTVRSKRPALKRPAAASAADEPATKRATISSGEFHSMPVDSTSLAPFSDMIL